MAVFEYVAFDASGKKTKGVVDADSAKGARSRLQGQGLFPESVKEVGEKKAGSGWNVNIDFSRKKVDSTALAVLTRQLATLVGAGMPLVEALTALAEQLDNPAIKSVISEVGDMVKEGSTLADGMSKHPKVFPTLYVNMVSSGEASGKLDIVLSRLADLYEGQALLQRKVVSAITYPALMLLLCVLAIVILLAFVVPEITSIFTEKGATLPLPTQIVVWLSDTLQSYWWLLILLAIGPVILLKRYGKTEKGRKDIDSLKFKLPLIGPLIVKVATSRFSRNLGTMLSSGVELLSALGIAKNIVGNVVMEEAIDQTIEGVREGKSLSSELKKTGVFPMILVYMLGVGERTGNLEPMLLRAADNYESEVDAVLTRLTSILEPILIIFIASIVCGILFAVMLPMLQMSSLAGGVPGN